MCETVEFVVASVFRSLGFLMMRLNSSFLALISLIQYRCCISHTDIILKNIPQWSTMFFLPSHLLCHPQTNIALILD